VNLQTREGHAVQNFQTWGSLLKKNAARYWENVVIDMKIEFKQMIILLAFSAIFFSNIVLVFAEPCPFDEDFLSVLKKSLIDFYQNPSTAKLGLGEIKNLLSFYLGNQTIVTENCSNINPILNKAVNEIPDDILPKTVGNFSCESCADGTVCNETNQFNQTCGCKDINEDQKYEICRLKPLYRDVWTQCDSCTDGTICNQTNQQNQTCTCVDVNKDSNYEICRLKPVYKPHEWEHCDSCADSTICNATNQLNQTCNCKDVNKDSQYEFCKLNPAWGRPIERPPCSICTDGTLCNQTNQQNQTCTCANVGKNNEFGFCILKPLIPVHPIPKSHPKCDSCYDGTACNSTDQFNQTCKCIDMDNDTQYEFCQLTQVPGKPRLPGLPNCSICTDGTLCNQTNKQNQTCTCADTNKDGKNKACMLRPFLPVKFKNR
jgi:hypothetical protein